MRQQIHILTWPINRKNHINILSPVKYIKYDGKNLNAKNEFVPLHAVYMKYVQYKTSQQYMIELLFILSIVKNRVWKYHRMLPGYFLLCCVIDSSHARFWHAVIHSPDF